MDDMEEFYAQQEKIVREARASCRCVEVAVQPDGSVVVPADLVAVLNVGPGQRCEIISDGYGVALRRPWVKPEPGTGAKLVERLRGSATGLGGMSTDEIMRITRGD